MPFSPSPTTRKTTSLRSEEHTSELQSPCNLVCRLLLEKKIDSMESDGTLRIDLRHSEGMAEMAFADDGCGMSAEVLENIFEAFFTKRKVGKGTGLGLSITHRIISQHHGEIHAETPREDRGATFTVRLPVRQAGAEPADTPAVAGPTS